MNNFNYISTIIFSVLLIIFGGIIIANPEGTMAAFAVFISIIMIITGIFNITLYRSMKEFKGSIYYLIEGAVSIIIAILLLSSAEALKNFVPLLIGFWIALKSATAIITAIEFKKGDNPNYKPILTGGVLGIALALLIAAFPKIVSIYISFILGIAFIAVGVFIIFFAYKMHKD